MTRDEVYATLKQAIEYGRSTVPVRLAYDQLVAHDAEQRRVIEDLQKRVGELIDRRNNFHREVVEWRGIEFDHVCTECGGSGYKVYGNTTTYHHGAGGQAITTSVCNKCWGSGDTYRPWTSWLQIEQQAKRLQELEEWQKIVTGTGTDQEAVVRMVATEYTKVAVQCWKEKCEQQAQQIAALREALQLLYDVQNGCPLPTYQKDWDRAMELTQQALKEVL